MEDDVMTNKSHPLVEKGDKIVVINILVPNIEKQHCLIKAKEIVAESAGSKSFMLNGNRFNQKDVGLPQPAIMHNSYRIAVPKGADVKSYIDIAKKMIKDAAKEVAEHAAEVVQKANGISESIDTQQIGRASCRERV